MPNNFPLVESTECLFNRNQILRKLPDIIFPLSLRNLYICHHFCSINNDRFHCESGNCGRSFLQFHNVAINGMITIIIFEILFLTRFCESYKYHCNHSAITFETCLFFFLLPWKSNLQYIFLLLLWKVFVSKLLWLSLNDLSKCSQGEIRPKGPLNVF